MRKSYSDVGLFSRADGRLPSIPTQLPPNLEKAAEKLAKENDSKKESKVIERRNQKIAVLNYAKFVLRNDNPTNSVIAFESEIKVRDAMPKEINYRTSDGVSKQSETADLIDAVKKWLLDYYAPLSSLPTSPAQPSPPDFPPAPNP